MGGKSCGSPGGEVPQNLTLDVEKECPKDCISNGNFNETEVVINQNNGSISFKDSSEIYRVISYFASTTFQLSNSFKKTVICGLDYCVDNFL